MKCFILTLFIFSFGFSQPNGIAMKYSRDAGIAQDPNVVFADNFEDSALDVGSRGFWSGIKGEQFIKTAPEVPSASSGKKSLWMPGADNSEMYANLMPRDSIFVRWYVKYQDGGMFHHDRVSISGNGNNIPAGAIPHDAFRVALEKCNNENRFDTYAYWPQMSCAGGCWGNYLIKNPSLTIWPSRWICVEMKLTINKPASQSNGSLAVWWDGQQVYNQGGFKWRSTDPVNIDKLTIQHYNTDPNHAPYSGDMWVDDLVVSKSYIGPLNTGAVSMNSRAPVSSRNPSLRIHQSANGLSRFNAVGSAKGPFHFRVLDLTGRTVWEHAAIASGENPIDLSWQSKNVPSGIYLCELLQDNRKTSARFFLNQ